MMNACGLRGRAILALMVAGLALFAGTAQERLLPERFLREYDPVTVFFSQDRGPREGGAGDDASALLSMSPAQPGEYRWLDARTLQFLPAEPWPALRTFTFRTPGESFSRSTLMAPPSSISPSPGSSNLASFDSLTLSFPYPLPVDSLSDMISLEVRSSPGLGSQEPIILTKRDFTLKEIDRSERKATTRYRLGLAAPVGDGKSVTVRFRLSLDEGIPGTAASYSYSTRTDFRVRSFGSGSVSYPLSSSGSSYPADQAIYCGTGTAPLFIEFSEAPDSETDLALLRSMVNFEPAVRNLRFEFAGNRLLLYFDRDPDTDYLFTLDPAELKSQSGRILSSFANSSFHFYYKSQSAYVQWSAGQALLERYGPQQFPMRARGIDKVDLRLYRIDPLDLNFWPFPEGEVEVKESSAPPMPGEEPAYGTRLAEQIRLLGSPDFSEVVGLPSREKGGASTFGLDLAPILKRIGREGEAGAYLVGYRRLGAETSRYYVRVQVTDLCLTLVEESRAVVFAVTSLATGKPVEGAAILLESRESEGDGSPVYKPLLTGRTDREGKFRYEHTRPFDAAVRRLSVYTSDDRLVIDPDQPPPYFHNNHWFGPQSRWLSWLTSRPMTADIAPRHLAYVFTERPIYRAEEPVHIQGYVRVREGGLVKAEDPGKKRSLLVHAPDGKDYRYPVEIKGNGYFYQLFDEKDLPTGSYVVRLLDAEDAPLASMTFKKEAYRIPSFEIDLAGPDRVPFDQPFQVLLSASYYAGGKVVGQSVEWSVAEGSWSLAPADWPGYGFSTYLSVGGEYREEGISASESEDVTDEDGSARISIDPRTAESIEARYYRIQASVRGADAQTVSRSKTVYALPPFSIGLRLPRFETDSMAVKPSIIVLDHEEKPLAGKELTLRLYERQWHSYLTESDISTGAAKYVSDIVDVPLLEKQLVSAKEALDLELPVEAAGVYIVEVQGRDAVGRLQSIKRDLYVSGPTPLAWKRTTAAIFETSLEKKMYEPGETARLLIQSPFQAAEAFVVVEKPSGNQYRWVEVKNGQGMVELPVSEELVPRFPVHIILMRGRLPGAPSQSGPDRFRPLSVANTTWITVDPSSNRLSVSLLHETKALPGSTFKVKILVKDREGRPVDGELALWLVDRAVLALAKERFASPLSSFITDVSSALRISDTRNLAVGNLPFEELAGGDMAEESAFGSLLDKTTVRKNFKTVPYYNPAVPIVNGVAEVEIPMPDNLTEFALRAIATAGFDKFGTARSVVAMRLPVVAQESLPRFLRPGDSLVAGGIARVVEGPGGSGSAELKLDGGLVLADGRAGDESRITLDPLLPTRLLYPLRVPLSLAGGREGSVSLTLGVERASDKARDAFMLELPLRNDTAARRMESAISPESRALYSFPFPKEEMRSGSTVQTLYLVSRPDLVQVLRSLHFQMSYPYGCTEQRIAKVHAPLALSAAFGAAGLPEEFRVPDAYMKSLFAYLESVITSSGLFSFYPGSEGSVSLTAYVVEFLALAKSAGYNPPPTLLDRPVTALHEALRSDYDLFAQGYSLLERGMALAALDAVDAYEPAYGQELLALAQDADPYTQARIWSTLEGKRGISGGELRRLRDRLGEQLVFQRKGGNLVLAGLQQKRSWFGNPFLYSDYRSVAAIYSVFAKDRPGSAETKAILDYLLDGAGYSGWGDTYTNTAVLLALADSLGVAPRKAAIAELWDGKGWRSLDGRDAAIVKLSLSSDVPLKVRMKSFDSKNPPSLVLETSYVPAAPGSELKARNDGFVVGRELLNYGSGAALLARYSAAAGTTLSFTLGSVIEDHVRVLNPADRSFVAVRVPLASGFEPLNPALETAPAEASPAGRTTLRPAWTDYEDHQVTFYYTSLPAGSYDFYFRVRANFEGSCIMPPASAQVLYELGVQGSSDGALVKLAPPPGE